MKIVLKGKFNIGEPKGLNELVTEATTIKLLGKNPYKDKFATTYRLSGYGELSYATTMIASAFGITESEFMDLADKGEKKFKETFETRYPGLNFSGKIQKIQDILAEMYDADKEEMRKVREAIGYKKLFDVLNETYSQRNFIDMQMPDYDAKKARYDEYRLNKNIVLVQKYIGISGKTSKKMLPDYEQIKEKAKIKSDEKQDFIEIASEISGQIKTRDNEELINSSKNIKRQRRSFTRIFSRMKKMLPEGRKEPEEIQEPKEDYFDEKRKRFLEENREEVDLSNLNTQKGDTEKQMAKGSTNRAEDPRQE